MKNQNGIFPPQRDPARGGTTLLTGIIIIVAIAIVAFGGVFIYQNFSTKTADQPQAQSQQQNQNANNQNEKLITLTYGEIKKEISNIPSGGEIDLNLIYPPKKTSADLYVVCPNGVTGNGIKYASWSNTVCNQHIDATYGAGYNFEFRNSTNQLQTITVNYTVYTSDGETHTQSVQFTVQPAENQQTGNVQPTDENDHTSIQDSQKIGIPNFAGHYIFQSYAGGDGLAVVIIDTETGQKYYPSELSTNASFDFQIGSNSIVAHPQTGDNGGKLKYYKWENNKLYFIQ